MSDYESFVEPLLISAFVDIKSINRHGHWFCVHLSLHIRSKGWMTTRYIMAYLLLLDTFAYQAMRPICRDWQMVIVAIAMTCASTNLWLVGAQWWHESPGEWRSCRRWIT